MSLAFERTLALKGCGFSRTVEYPSGVGALAPQIKIPLRACYVE